MPVPREGDAPFPGQCRGLHRRRLGVGLVLHPRLHHLRGDTKAGQVVVRQLEGGVFLHHHLVPPADRGLGLRPVDTDDGVLVEVSHHHLGGNAALHVLEPLPLPLVGAVVAVNALLGARVVTAQAEARVALLLVG